MSATEFLTRVAEFGTPEAFHYALGALAGAVDTGTTENVFADTLEGLANQFALREAA